MQSILIQLELISARIWIWFDSLKPPQMIPLRENETVGLLTGLTVSKSYTVNVKCIVFHGVCRVAVELRVLHVPCCRRWFPCS